METTFDLVNNELLAFVDSFGSSHANYARNFHKVGDDLRADHVHHLVRLGRFLKKFEKPELGNQDDLHQSTVARWLATDHELSRITEATLIRGAFDDIRIIRMKRLIHDWCNLFEMRLEDAWVGPGETYRSSGGDVSAYGKFLKHERWTVTRDCYPFFESVIRHNRPLRRWALEEGRKKLESMGVPEDSQTFERCLESLVEIVLGARITTVPKNNEKRRPINIEPFGNSMLQHAIGAGLERVLASIGNDLKTGQDKHRDRIKNDDVATIDLSDASDRVSVELVRFLFPERVFSVLEAIRSKCTEVDGVYIRTNKISCQGNGFTFPLMTIILLAACKACGDDESSVYGDDIIVKNDVATNVIQLIEKLGFKVNHEKSFVSRQFRESCGGFYYRGYIRCFDIAWVTNFPELCSTLNKVLLYKLEGQDDASDWAALHECLLRHVPDEYKAPIPERDRDRLDTYCWVEDSTKLAHLKVGACHWLGTRFDRRAGEIRFVYTYMPEILDFYDDQTHCDRYSNLVGVSLRIKAGSPVKRYHRGKVRWTRVGVFVDSGGALMLEKQYRYLRNDEVKYLKGAFGVDKVSAEHWEAYTMRGFELSEYYAALDAFRGKSYLKSQLR